MRAPWELWLVVAIAVVLCTSCGGSGGDPKKTSKSTVAEVRVVWATAARSATETLRANHLGAGSSSDLDKAYEYGQRVCTIALSKISDTDVADVRRGCDTMTRAATTPKIAAAPIYERAFDAFDAAGAKPTLDELDADARKEVVTAVFDTYEPAISNPKTAEEWEMQLESLKTLCNDLLGGKTIQCKDLLELWAFTPKPDAAKVAERWHILRRAVVGEANP